MVRVILAETFGGFNTSTLQQIFWKTKTFFKKLEWSTVSLVENAKIKNASFWKTWLKKVIENCHVSKPAMSAKWTYHKELSFASN